MGRSNPTVVSQPEVCVSAAFQLSGKRGSGSPGDASKRWIVQAEPPGTRSVRGELQGDVAKVAPAFPVPPSSPRGHQVLLWVSFWTFVPS